MYYLILIIIIYIYHALSNALSAHLIHINLNMIFYTHVNHLKKKKSVSDISSFLHNSSEKIKLRSHHSSSFTEFYVHKTHKA